MTKFENDAEFLAYLGTDGVKWAEEFVRVYKEIREIREDDPIKDEGWLIGWFANAIEAGSIAGYRRAKEEYYKEGFLDGVKTCQGTFKDALTLDFFMKTN